MPVGPDYEELSPRKSLASRYGFPVVDNLDERLLKADTAGAPDHLLRYALAVCSGYAYSDVDTVSTMMTRVGLAKSHCVEFSFHNDAMFIDSTAFLVQSRDGRVAILCYRGTQPLNLIDWLTDVDVAPDIFSVRLAGSETASVHSGFYRNVRATRHKVIRALTRAIAGRSVIEDNHETMAELEALYITGHSLGGAMALLMGVILHTETAYREIRDRLKAIYTFGQPMVGSPQFAEHCRKDSSFPPVVRYIHGRDVVPHLPPLESGEFAHIGSEYQYHNGHWALNSTWAGQANVVEGALVPGDFVVQKISDLRTTASVWNKAASVVNQGAGRVSAIRLASTLVGRLPLGDSFNRLPLVYSIEDHGPHHYVSRLAPQGVFSEFGDVR